MNYQKAPIREAIFDIRIKKLEGKTIEDFQHFFDKLNDQFASMRKINNLEGTFTFGNNRIDETQQIFGGVILSSEKNDRQVQFRIDGFSLNYLPVYSNWETFSNEAKSLWQIYRDNFPTIKVERIALRYINRIDIPLPFEKFDEYVSLIPPIPNVLPQIYKSFFTQINVPLEKIDCAAIISTTIQTQTEKHIPYILDIDVFQMTTEVNFEDFDYLRQIKNEIFESCVTDKARQLFK